MGLGLGAGVQNHRSWVSAPQLLCLFPLSDVGDAFQFINNIIAERRKIERFFFFTRTSRCGVGVNRTPRSVAERVVSVGKGQNVYEAYAC